MTMLTMMQAHEKALKLMREMFNQPRVILHIPAGRSTVTGIFDNAYELFADRKYDRFLYQIILDAQIETSHAVITDMIFVIKLIRDDYEQFTDSNAWMSPKELRDKNLIREANAYNNELVACLLTTDRYEDFMFYFRQGQNVQVG